MVVLTNTRGVTHLVASSKLASSLQVPRMQTIIQVHLLQYNGKNNPYSIQSINNLFLPMKRRYSSIHLSFCPSDHPFIHPSICPSICPSIHFVIHVYIHLSIFLSICACMHSTNHPFIYNPCIHPFIHPCTHAPLHSFINLAIISSIPLVIYPFIPP